MTTAGPQVELNPLNRADGSAQWKENGTSVIVGVNGPMEASKMRDELPAEAAVEVVVRPGAGVTSTKEKYMEERIRSALKPVILRNMHPRKVIQIVVQIVEVNEKRMSDTWMLPTFLNTAMLALLCAGVQLSKTIFSTLVVTLADGSIVCGTKATLLKRDGIKSVHALGFDASGTLLFIESDGQFTDKEWPKIVKAGKKDALGPTQELVRSLITSKIEKDLKWRQ